MNQGAQANETWADAPTPINRENPAVTTAAAEPVEQWEEAEDLGSPRRGPGLLIGGLLAVVALAWIAGLGWALAQATPAQGFQPLRLAAWIGLASAPLALLATLYLLLLRTGRLEATAYGRAAAQLRADSRLLQATLDGLNVSIAAARADLATHAGDIDRLGRDASARVSHAAGELGQQGAALTQTARVLDDATATARADLGVLLSDLPQAEAIARAIGEGLRESSGEADRQARALAQLLDQLTGRIRETNDAGTATTANLAVQMDRVGESAIAADRRMADAAETMARAIDTILGTTATSVEQTRQAVTAQNAALAAMVEQARTHLVITGEEALGTFGARVDELVERVDGLASGLHRHDADAHGLLTKLDERIRAVEARFAALNEKGAEQAAGMSESILSLADQADAVGRRLGGSSELADTLLGRVSQLREQAEASSAAIADTIPAALARIRLHAEHSLQAITAAGQRTEELATAAGMVSERLAEADLLLDRQRSTLEEVGNRADSRIQSLHEQTATLEEMLRRADAEVQSLSEGASVRLVEALNQVRETAAQASEQARDALSSAIPRVAQRLGESASRAMTLAIAEVGKTEMASVGAVSEQAIEAARLATERLTRQLLTIAETSTAIQARIDANATDTEAHDDQSFARTVSLLIEALNSTAIDVAKIFSNEVSDEEWRAYLRGDRGIFTRRAVKLIDRADSAVIVQRYNEDTEFRDQVNRYVHDFEAVIRRVMATRDGTPIATAMLSSDTGKLYVALAQAIERLRK
jgi:hypothetical protein